MPSFPAVFAMYTLPPSIDETWPVWVLGVMLVSVGAWFLVSRLISPLAVARVAAIFVAIAGVLLYTWLAHEELTGSTAHPRARVQSVVEMALYMLLPSVAPLYLLRRRGGADERRLAGALGILVTFGTLVSGAAAFFLLMWASKRGEWGTAMLIVQSPLAFLAVTGITLTRSAWRAARE
jgi:hypothetical protein